MMEVVALMRTREVVVVVVLQQEEGFEGKPWAAVFAATFQYFVLLSLL